jgi:phospholipid/cholesterol/gamma-HCH transport system permease protein
VLTGLIIAARAGGAMAARIGTMRVSEQIDALEVMGVDPQQYLVAPRMIAAFFSTPMLCAIFDFVAMLGSYFVCVKLLEMDNAVFWDKVQLWTEPRHIFEGLVKAAVFGAIFSVVCTYKGFNTEGGARGVGEATNRGVVLSMVLIIVLDYFLTNLLAIYFGIIDA